MTWNIAIKNCGMKTADAVDAAVRSGADYLGFILYPPSPRHIAVEAAAELSRSLPPHIRTVAVLVNPDDEQLKLLLAHWRPDLLQLHGQESPRRAAAIRARHGLPVIKALPVATAADIAQAADYAESADYLLFDTKSQDLHGGTGQAFDWSLLQGVELKQPWFLSGGLTAENIADALRTTRAAMVDVSSGLESARGVKDRAKIAAFNEAVHGFRI